MVAHAERSKNYVKKRKRLNKQKKRKKFTQKINKLRKDEEAK